MTPWLRYLIAFVVGCHGFTYIPFGILVIGTLKEWRGSSLLLRSAVTDGRLRALAVALQVVAGIATLACAVAIGFIPFLSGWRDPLALGGAAVGLATIAVFWDGQIQFLFQEQPGDAVVGLFLIMTGIVFTQAFGSRRGRPTMNGLRIRKNSDQCLYEAVLLTRIEYFKARLDATTTPVDVLRDMKSDPHRICVVDVRNGPASRLIDRIADALQITQSEILAQLGKLSEDRVLVLYCWNTWCDLAIRTAVPLLERGYDVKELFGGIRAWKTLQCPTEPADAEALARQSTPVRVIPL